MKQKDIGKWYKDISEEDVNTDEGHLGGYIRGSEKFPHGDPWSWSPELWKWIYEKLGVRSVLDVGCGEGHSTRFFKDLGCKVMGIDGSAQAKKNSVIPESHIIHDFTKGEFIPKEIYDLVWSCEFVEHIERRYVNNFLKTFSCAKKFIMITYAPPGQGGIHHVNCQPAIYWRKRLSYINFKVSYNLTKVCREIAEEGHFKQKGLVFVRCNNLIDKISTIFSTMLVNLCMTMVSTIISMPRFMKIIAKALYKRFKTK